MFKKLKEKIAEEVKPLKIPQFAQSVVSPGSTAAVENPPNEAFSLDDELPEDSLGNEGFSVVDLHHPSVPVPLSSGQFSRQSSMSSLASDASAFLPIHDASLGAFNMQDLESASEREDVLPQMNNLSKQELCNSYLKLFRHYQKYKGRATDLKKFCRELEKDNKKHKTVLLECQEKSLRRMAELKEQCALEQHAKAHLEEALRNDLEEKDHLIQTLQTKINLLKEAHLAHSSSLINPEDENLLDTSGNIGLKNMEELFENSNTQINQDLLNQPVPEMNLESRSVSEEGQIRVLRNKIEYCRNKILKDSLFNDRDTSMKKELQDLLSEMSVHLLKKISVPSLSEQKHSNNTTSKILPSIETAHFNDNFTSLEQTPDELGNKVHDLIESSTTFEQSKSKLDNSSVVSPAEHVMKCATDGIEEMNNNAIKLENELSVTKNKLDEVTQELNASQLMISNLNVTITSLNEKIATLQYEVETIKEGHVTNDTLLQELAEAKNQLDEFQRKCDSAQHALEEKNLELKAAKQSFDNVLQELDAVSTSKIDIMKTLTIQEKELKETKCLCEQLSLNLEAGDKRIKERELTIEQLNAAIIEVQKDLDVMKTLKTKDSETISILQNELEETKLKYEQTAKDLVHGSRMAEEKESVIENMKEDCANLHKAMNKLSSQKVQACDMASGLQTELKVIKDKYEETTKELQSFQIIIEEKNNKINDINKELTRVLQELDITIKEKNNVIEEATITQNELSNAKKQLSSMNEELKSACESNELKDSEILKMHANYMTIQQELNVLKSQKSKEENVEAIKNDLVHFKSLCENLSEKLQEANKLVDEKNDNLINMRQDLENLRNELDVALQKGNEKSTMVTVLQTDLSQAKLELEKMTQKTASFSKLIEEKELTIANRNSDLIALQKSFETTSSQKVKASEMATNLQNELANIYQRMNEMSEELNSAQKLANEKDSNYMKVNEEVCSLNKELDLALSEKADAKVEIVNLQKELESSNVNFKVINEELQSTRKLLEERDLKIACLSEELKNVQKLLDAISVEKQETSDKLFSLKKELTDTKLEFEEVNQQLLSVHCSMKEKDLTIMKLSEGLCAVQKELGDTLHQKDEALAVVKELKVTLKLAKLSDEHVDKEFGAIENLTQELCIVQEELANILHQKAEALELVKDLQEEMKEAKLIDNHIDKEFKAAQQLIADKDSTIAYLTSDITKINKELDSISSVNDETCKAVNSLRLELEESKTCCDKLSDKVDSGNRLLEEKDLSIAHLKEDLFRVQEELNKSSFQHVQANETVTNLEIELKATMLRLEHIDKALLSLFQFVREKKVNSQISSDTDGEEDSIHSLHELGSLKLISVLQQELESGQLKLETMVEKLHSLQKVIEEKDVSIKKLEMELYKKQDDFDNIKHEDHIQSVRESNGRGKIRDVRKLEICDLGSTTFIPDNGEEIVKNKQKLKICSVHNSSFIPDDVHENDDLFHPLLGNKLTENSLPIENLDDKSMNNFTDRSMQILGNTINDEELCDNSETYSNKNIKQDISDDSCRTHIYARTVKSSDSEKVNDMLKFEMCAVSSTSFVPEVENIRLCQGCSAILSEHPLGSVLDSEDSRHKSSHGSLMNNVIDSSLVHIPGLISPLKESAHNDKILYLSNETECGSGDSYESRNCEIATLKNEQHTFHPLPDLHLERKRSVQNVSEALPATGQIDRHQGDEQQHSNIQNILEQIQKENKEYGSLLECHKSIIDHLGEIAKFQSEGTQPGSAEWLHKQLIMLSQKLYDTKEKQRMQLASINRLVKHQKDLIMTENTDGQMTIEMQYLRNIVFQYMIGKETMLLAKVISAVMKFDQQQMDQVLQREQQKQTLFGQLGLL